MTYPLSNKQYDLLQEILRHRFLWNGDTYTIKDSTRSLLVDICVDKCYTDTDRPKLTKLRSGYIQSELNKKEVSDEFALLFLKNYKI